MLIPRVNLTSIGICQGPSRRRDMFSSVNHPPASWRDTHHWDKSMSTVLWPPPLGMNKRTIIHPHWLKSPKLSGNPLTVLGVHWHLVLEKTKRSRGFVLCELGVFRTSFVLFLNCSKSPWSRLCFYVAIRIRASGHVSSPVIDSRFANSSALSHGL